MEKTRLGPRVVTKAFEAWDPTFGMIVIMNSGIVVQVGRIVFDVNRHPILPPIKRAVEFLRDDTLYYAEFNRFEENTSECVEAL